MAAPGILIQLKSPDFSFIVKKPKIAKTCSETNLNSLRKQTHTYFISKLRKDHGTSLKVNPEHGPRESFGRTRAEPPYSMATPRCQGHGRVVATFTLLERDRSQERAWEDQAREITPPERELSCGDGTACLRLPSSSGSWRRPAWWSPAAGSAHHRCTGPGARRR